jgi:hypothetical protein
MCPVTALSVCEDKDESSKAWQWKYSTTTAATLNLDFVHHPEQFPICDFAAGL